MADVGPFLFSLDLLAKYPCKSHKMCLRGHALWVYCPSLRYALSRASSPKGIILALLNFLHDVPKLPSVGHRRIRSYRRTFQRETCVHVSVKARTLRAGIVLRAASGSQSGRHAGNLRKNDGNVWMLPVTPGNHNLAGFFVCQQPTYYSLATCWEVTPPIFALLLFLLVRLPG